MIPTGKTPIPDMPFPGQWMKLEHPENFWVRDNGFRYEAMWKCPVTGVHLEAYCHFEESLSRLVEYMEECRIKQEREDVKAFRNH